MSTVIYNIEKNIILSGSSILETVKSKSFNYCLLPLPHISCQLWEMLPDCKISDVHFETRNLKWFITLETHNICITSESDSENTHMTDAQYIWH